MRLVCFASLLIQRREFGKAPEPKGIECCRSVEGTSGGVSHALWKAERFEAHRLRHGESIALELALK